MAGVRRVGELLERRGAASSGSCWALGIVGLVVPLPLGWPLD